MSADPRRATKFLLSALAWSLGLFALLRLRWVEERLLVPLTALQKQSADYYAGTAAAPINVTLECSGADVLALCLAVIVACPVSWRARALGALGALAFVLSLNTVRIATLGLASASPALLDTLHLQVWPAILVLAAAAYVFAWMRMATGAAGREDDGDGTALFPLARRFAPRAAVLLVAFALCGPWIARSETLVMAGAWTASAAASLLGAAGLAARATGNVLATSRGLFIVTPDCLATALIPLYLAAVFTARWTWSRRLVALAAAPLLFTGLALVRLLLLALPPALASSPLFLVHGFHQLVLAVVGVVLLAWWREPPTPRRWVRAAARAGAALCIAAVLVVIAGGFLTTAVVGAARAVAGLGSHTLLDLTGPGDAQGALAVLPAYQVGLLLAFAMTAFAGWRRLLAALGVLLASQVAFLVALGVADHAGLAAHALLLRAWAVGVPVALMLLMLRAAPPAAGALASLRPVDGLR